MAQIAGTGTGVDFAYIGNIILLLIGLYGVSAIFSYIQGWIMTDISMKLTYQFRKEISQKINRLPLHYFDTTTQGEVLSRITNDVDTINQTLNQSLTQIITSVVTMKKMMVVVVLMVSAAAAQAAASYVVSSNGSKVLDGYGAVVLTGQA